MQLVINVRYGSISGNPANVNPNAGYVGHTWIDIKDGGATVLSAGYDPQEGGLMGGLPGVVEPDSGPADWHSDPIEISDEEYQNLIDFVQRTQSSPPEYSPWGGDGDTSYNCTTWVRRAIDEMGIPLPSATINWLPVRFPESFLPQYPDGDPATGMPWPGVDASANTYWRTALTPPRRDPLAIDLDGDGIETVGIPTNGNPILFDHDADGVKTGTGWLKSDDAWLVLDRNGNGTIDSGRELFGVDTVITVTELVTNADGSFTQQAVTRNARSGFEALRSLDTGDGSAGSTGYADGVFDASDAQFANVRMWRDLNQDGVSQSNELFSLPDAGIESIALTPTTNTSNLGNGNSVTGTATVHLTDGRSTLADTVDVAANNLELASNPFYRSFTDSIPLTVAARALPAINHFQIQMRQL